MDGIGLGLGLEKRVEHGSCWCRWEERAVCQWSMDDVEVLEASLESLRKLRREVQNEVN